MSVSFLPFVRVTVAFPLESEPPAIPTFALVLVRETSRKTGSPDGKAPPTATSSEAPLTEILAWVAFAAGCLDTGGGGGGGGAFGFELPAAFKASFACCTNGSLSVKRSNDRSCPLE